MKNSDKKTDILGFEATYLKSLILLTSIFIFLSPIIVYYIIFLISHLFPIELLNRIRIGNAETWIGFAGSIIGGSMTMFAVVFTLFYESISKKKERALDSLPIIEIKPIFAEDSLNSKIVHGNQELWIELVIINTSSNPARNLEIKLSKYLPTGIKTSDGLDLSDDVMMMNYNINTLASNSQKSVYLKIASSKIDDNYMDIFDESKIYVTFYLETELTDINEYVTRTFKTTINGYLIQNDIIYSDVYNMDGKHIGEEYNKFTFRPLTYYTDMK